MYYHIKLFISEELFEILEDMESLIYLFVYFSDNELQDEAWSQSDLDKNV